MNEGRKKILVGFGGTAVVLAAAIAYMSPNFPYRSEDASGAIGAVEKHRQTQITPQDVVLGDEQLKQEQGVLYADYLRDASQLQNIGVELAAAAQTLDLRRLSQAEQALAARDQELSARFRAQAENALAAMKQLGRSADDFRNQLAARGRVLGAADMEALSSRAVEASNDLGPDNVQKNAEREIGAFTASLQHESALAASPQLASLRSAIEADSLAARLRAQADYLAAMSKQAMSLEASRRALSAKSYGQASEELFAVANELEARAVRNMKANMMFNAERAEQLGRMSAALAQAEAALASRAQQFNAQHLEKSRNDLAAYRRELMNNAEQLNSRSRYALNAQLEAADGYFSARGQASRAESLAAFAEHFGSMEQLQKRAVLASAAADTQNLAQRAREMANRLAAQQRE